MQPLPLKYHKKVVPTLITGTHKDGFFRVVDDGNKSTYMYQRYNKYTPKCTQLLPEDPHLEDPHSEARCQTDQMANTGGKAASGPEGPAA